jgi:hypothetical protein
MNNSETTAGEAAELFRRTMVSITDQAQAEGREGEVMEALFPLFLGGVGDDD